MQIQEYGVQSDLPLRVKFAGPQYPSSTGKFPSFFMPLDVLLLTCDSGEERWRSEGIQVGGINSKRGVAGTWFDKNYDPHGPAGPTAFWKMADMSLKEVDEDDQSGSESESDDW